MESRDSLRQKAGLALGLALASMLAISPARAASTYAYVVDSQNDSVTVVDTDTNTIVTAIPVADQPVSAAALSDGSKLYVSHLFAEIASVIDTATNTVIGTVPIGPDAQHITALPDGSAVYASSYLQGQVHVIDPTTDTNIGVISVGQLPWGMAALPDSTGLYVVGSDAVRLIDTATNTVSATIPVEANARHAVVLPDGTSLFVTHPGNQRPSSGKYSVIDTATNTVVDVRKLTEHPAELDVTPDGSRVYIVRTNIDNFGAVSVVGAASHDVVDTVGLAPIVRDVAFVPDGSRAYVVGHGSLWVIETSTNALTAIIPIGGFHRSIAIATFPVCGDGELDPGEVCDDGNANETDCCSSACLPASPAGTPCNDGDVCNGVETTCDAFGLCQSSPALDCDDGALCTRDFCDPITGCFHESDALLTCAGGFERGSLTVDEDSPGNEKLTVKFLKGPALSQTDFGDPLGLPFGTTAYALCIYDPLGNLLESLDVDRAGDSCGTNGAKCWKSVGTAPPDGKGYVFKDADASSDGVRKLLVKGGDAGRSKALVKAKNSTMLGQSSLPTGIAAALAGATSATIQIVSSDAECLTLTLDDVAKAEPTLFKGSFRAP